MFDLRMLRLVVVAGALLLPACGGGGAGPGTTADDDRGIPALEGAKPATVQELVGTWTLYNFLIEDLTTGAVYTPANTGGLQAVLELSGDGMYAFSVCGQNGCDNAFGTWSVDATRFWDNGAPVQYSYDGDHLVLEDLGTLPQDRHVYHVVIWFERSLAPTFAAEKLGTVSAKPASEDGIRAALSSAVAR